MSTTSAPSVSRRRPIPAGFRWSDEYSEHLRGADVVVLPDNHAEGREHADQVVTSLRGVAKRTRILDIGKHWAGCS